VKTAITRPKVFIPTMPGTNCEVDSARAFERAGADTDIFIMRNRDAAEDSHGDFVETTFVVT